MKSNVMKWTIKKSREKNEEEQKQERTTQERTFESETNKQTKANQVKMMVHRHKLKNFKSNVYVSAKNASIFFDGLWDLFFCLFKTFSMTDENLCQMLFAVNPHSKLTQLFLFVTETNNSKKWKWTLNLFWKRFLF